MVENYLLTGITARDELNCKYKRQKQKDLEELHVVGPSGSLREKLAQMGQQIGL
jgi:hypothetical protein